MRMPIIDFDPYAPDMEQLKKEIRKLQSDKEKLFVALNAAHYYIDASDDELRNDGLQRSDALRHARLLRDECNRI